MMDILPSKAQPLVGPFKYRQLLILAILAGLMVYQPLYVVAIEFTLVAGLILLLCNPWLIWPLIGLVLPYASSVSLGPATATELLVICALGFWFVDGVRRRELRLAFGLPSLLLLLFVCYHIGLLFIAPDLGEAIPEVVKWFEILLVLTFLPPMVSAQNRQWIVIALLLAGSTQALLGIYQFVYQIGHPSFILLERFMRASGTFAQPNPFAGYLGTLLPVAVSMTLYALFRLTSTNDSAKGHLGELLIFGGTAAIIGVGIIVSWSRGGWLGTLIGVGFVVVLRSRRALIISIVTCVMILGFVAVSSLDPSLLPSSITGRLGNLSAYAGVNIDQVLEQEINDDNFAVIERMAHWKAALLMWQDAPLFGVGPGGYEAAYPEVIRTDARLMLWEKPLGHAHNIYLNFLAEIGLIGLVLYLGMVIVLLGWVWTQVRQRLIGGDARNSALAIGILGVMLYLSVHNVFDNLYVNGIYLHLGFWIALLDKE